MMTLACVSHASELVQAKVLPKLIVLTEQLYPLSYTLNGQDNEEILGVATELVVTILEASGIDYEMRIVPWSRVIKSMDSRENILAFSMARTNQREEKYFWIGEITPIRFSLYGLTKNLNNLPKSMQEARQMKIGTFKSGITHEYLKTEKFTNLVEIKTNKQYLHLLDIGRIDLFPYIDALAEPWLLRQQIDPKRLTKVFTLPDYSSSLFIALSKSSDPRLREQIYTAYQKIRHNGRYDEIMSPSAPKI